MKSQPNPLSLAFRSAFAVLLLVPLLVPAVGPAQTGSFEERTDVVVVEVPVQVLDDDEPVRGLTADDFVILDRGRKQKLVGFEVIDLATVEPGEAGEAVPQLPVAARRHFLLLFDLSFSDPTAVVRAREAAYDLVADGLHPSDLVAVATYSEAHGPRLVLGFTSDRNQMAAAIDTLGIADPIARVSDPLGIVISDLGTSPLGSGSGSGGGLRGISPGAELANQLQALSVLGAQAARAQQQAQVEALAASLSQLAGLMNSVQGRKHVVYFSEGFDASVILGTSGNTLEEQQRIQEIADAASSGQFWEVDSEERFGSTASLGVMTRMIEAFQRADCTIQAVDIGGLRAGGDVQGGSAAAGSQARGEDGLFMMANQTGGEMYRNFNDLSGAMGEMLHKTSVTYLLAFQPRNLELDGEFHKLKIQLDGRDKKGMRLVHRPGYFAPRPYAEQNPFERRLAAAEKIVGGSEGGVLDTSVLAAPVAIPGERAYVPVLIEIDGTDLLAGHAGDALPTEVYAYALDRRGGVADFFTQAMALDVAEAGDALRATGFKYWGHFDLDPGDYVVRVMVRNGATGVSSLRSVDLRVPSFDTEIAVLPPLFPEPPGTWLIGREQPADQRDVPYPFMMRGQPYIPAARPALTARGEAPLYLVGYNLAEGLLVEGRLVAPDGSVVEGAELEVVERYAGAVSDQMVATFRPGKASPGEYTLEVVVTDAESGEARTSAIRVVVAEG